MRTTTRRPTHLHRALAPLVALTLTLALAGCSSDTTTTLDATSTADASLADVGAPHDATTPEDAAPLDAAAPDAAPLDAAAPDAAPLDAAAPDAAPLDAAAPDTGPAPTCDAIGQACTGGCPSPYFCQNGACIPEQRATCGGFTGASCPAGYPDCLYFAGADYGPCFTAAEHACICAQPNAHALFPVCP